MLECTLLGRIIPDDILLRARFLIKTGELLDLKNPKNFSQKIQWIKLYDRNPLYTMLADKYAVREYVARKIGEEYLIPLLWAGKKFDDINFDELPDQFVIKCNHDCGSVIICENKKYFDIKSARKKIKKALRKNYYFGHPGRQWQYKDIPPQIIIEKYISNASGEKISDYKIFCFNGKPKYIGVYSDRFEGSTKITYFDLDWNVLPFTTNKKKKKHAFLLPKPEKLEDLISLSKILSKDAIFVRVDFYVVNTTSIFFGELTFTPRNGINRFEPPQWNKICGDYLKLPNKQISGKTL